MQAHILSLHPRPLRWGQRSKQVFSESSRVAVLTHPQPVGWIKR